MTADGNSRLPDTNSSGQPHANQTLAEMRVLIAEDTWHTAISLQRTITRAGGRIAGMASTLADLQRLATDDCDAVVMDLNLNGEMAHELAGQLAARGLKVVVLSGYRRPPTLDRRIHAFLEKPSTASALIAALLAPPQPAGAPPPA